MFDNAGKFWALTRDMWGMAMKATHGVFGGKEVPIYKDPKTDKSGLKKSQKGCCAITYNPDENTYACQDGFDTWVPNHKTVLTLVFRDSRFYNMSTFKSVRGRMYGTL